jgi:uncharacterized protein with HEPN domain
VKKTNLVYLRHILDAVRWIGEYTRGMDHDTFLANHLVQDAVLKQIEVIGEAAKHLSPDFTDAYPAVPWKDIAGMRDFIVHNYFGVDVEAVYKTVIVDIPLLKEEIAAILQDFRES